MQSADDIVLLAPTLSAMRKMPSVCDSYAANFNITFNAYKSKWVFFLPKNCDDASDINRGRVKLISGITSFFILVAVLWNL